MGDSKIISLQLRDKGRAYLIWESNQVVDYNFSCKKLFSRIGRNVIGNFEEWQSYVEPVNFGIKALQTLERQALKKHHDYQVTMQVIGSDDQLYYWRVDRQIVAGKPECYIWWLDDLTTLVTTTQVHQRHLKVIGHELKQPLSLIKAYLYQLKSGATSDIAKLAGDISGQVDILNRMLNDVADTSRATLGMYIVRRKTQNLSEWLQTVCSTFASAHDQVKIECQVEIDQVEAKIDPVRLSQAITNILNNSLKYADATKPITVTLKLTSKSLVQITIADVGEGIPVGLQQGLFEIYVRGDSTSQQKQGLGLGLWMARMIVQKHQGSIKLDASYTKGVKFVIELPAI